MIHYIPERNTLLVLLHLEWITKTLCEYSMLDASHIRWHTQASDVEQLVSHDTF